VLLSCEAIDRIPGGTPRVSSAASALAPRFFSFSSTSFASCFGVESNSVGTGIESVKNDVCPDSSMFWK